MGHAGNGVDREEGRLGGVESGSAWCGKRAVFWVSRATAVPTSKESGHSPEGPCFRVWTVPSLGLVLFQFTVNGARGTMRGTGKNFCIPINLSA